MNMIRRVYEQKKGKKTETEQIRQKGRYQIGFTFQHQLTLTAALDVPVAKNLKADGGGIHGVSCNQQGT